MTVKKSKKRRKIRGRVLVYVEKRLVPGNLDKRPFWPSLHYYGRYSGSKDMVEITKSVYEKFIGDAVDKQLLERKQGGKRGAGEIPGAGHCWPMACEALACHPDQVAAFNERNKKHGINVSYDRKGFAIIPDQAAYRRLMKAEGVHQNNCFN